MSFETIGVTTRYDVPELWSMIMGASWEQWEWWVDHSYNGGAWDKPCTLVVMSWGRNENPNPNTFITTEITITDVARALEQLWGWGDVCTALAKRDFDAVSSDAVIQQCVYGEVVYG